MRLELTRRSRLAVMVLRHLAQRSARVSTTELAATVGTTASFLPKVMSPLVRHGWVRSVAGPGGGYELTADPGGISVLHVVEALDGPLLGRACLISPEAHAHNGCPFHSRWERAVGALVEELGRLRVSDGLDQPVALAPVPVPALQKGTLP